MNILESIVVNGAKLRPLTKRNYQRAVRDWLAYAGESPVGWTPACADTFYRQLLQTMQPQSASVLLNGLKYASKRYASIHGGLDFACAIETVPNEERDAPVPLGASDLHQLLASCRGDNPIDIRDRGMLLLGVTTGMRRAGMVGISFADFQTTRFGYPVVGITLKGGKRFSVPLLPQIAAALQPWQSWLATQAITKGPFFRSISIATVKGTRTIGDALTPDGLSKVLKRRAKVAVLGKNGEQRFHPHILRHTFITRCRDAGVPVHEIAAITGHHLEGTIDRFYVNPATIGASALQSIAPVFADLVPEGV